VNQSQICHSGKSRNLSNVNGIPAFAGMTNWWNSLKIEIDQA
jgi:hypothetical protein